jgi:outer membrane protein assembly factor BamB
MALDSASGAELWGRQLDGVFVDQLMVSGGSVIVVPAGCALFAPLDGLLNLDTGSGATLEWWGRGAGVVLDAAARGLLLEGTTAERAVDGSVAWRASGTACTPPNGGPTVVVAGTVAFTSNAWELCAFDVDTGTQLGHWTFGPAFDIPLALIAADGCVYATSETGGVDSINALCVAS